MGELRDSLTSEVNDLRSDFETLRSSLRQQIDATTTLAQGEIRRNANSADQVRLLGEQAGVRWQPVSGAEQHAAVQHSLEPPPQRACGLLVS